MLVGIVVNDFKKSLNPSDSSLFPSFVLAIVCKIISEWQYCFIVVVSFAWKAEKKSSTTFFGLDSWAITGWIVINDKIKSVLLKISELGIAKRKDLHDAIKISMPTIDRILKQLISEDLNLIEYQGSRKTGGYVLTEKGKAFIKSMNE